MTTPHSTAEHVVHFAPDGTMRVHPRDRAFTLPPDTSVLASGWLLSVFTYERTWDHQERHPDADELVTVIAGTAALLLDEGGGEHSTSLTAGDLAVIPAGAWHRLGVESQATLLFVTPRPADTQHRPLAAS
jgi:quercetin dioxygenase-like cupin family protein